jgi:hypothetical protein
MSVFICFFTCLNWLCYVFNYYGQLCEIVCNVACFLHLEWYAMFGFFGIIFNEE